MTRRRSLVKAKQAGHLDQTSGARADFDGALIIGLLVTIWRLDRLYGDRLRDHIEDLLKQHRLRSLAGRGAADVWLRRELKRLALPDRRKWRTLRDDVTLVRRYDALQRQLRLIFRFPLDGRRRNKRAAPVVSAITGEPRSADQLPENENLAAFCQEVLGVTGVTLSRARRRVAESAAGQLSVFRKRLKLFKKNFPSRATAQVTELTKFANAIATKVRQIAPRRRTRRRP